MLRPLFTLFGALTLVTGLAYPLAVTAAAQVLFPGPASGSLVVVDGQVVGSALIAQTFDRPEYFWGRPSAVDVNAGTSGGSNLGPTNPELLARVQVDGPRDLVTTSGSGLDPHISPEGAASQVARVAAARGRPIAEVEALVDAHTEGPTFGVLGEARVNVLLLNLALDGAAR